jgi:peptide/nickel transport system substrate-binding protein
MTRIDRRALFSTGAAAALLAATGVTLDAAPKAGGTLRLAVPRDDSLDKVARGALFDTLTEIGPDGALRGELATSWQASPDARIWTIDLRDDVLLHDGTALQISDVTKSLETLEELNRIDATGPYQLRLELAQGNLGLPFLLADSQSRIGPDGQVDGPLAAAVGTGCYRASHAQDGRHFRGTKVTTHYKQGQAGWVDQVEVIVIPDAAVRAEALRDGYVDVAALPHPEGLRERSKFRYHPSERDMALAVAGTVGMPRQISPRAVLDDGRVAERWWML